MQVYSQINLQGITPQQAAIDSANRWQPPENIDPNWRDYKDEIISAVQDNTRVSLPEDFFEKKKRTKKELKCDGITSEQREAYVIGTSELLYRAIEPRKYQDIPTILQKFIPQSYYGRDFLSKKLDEIRTKFTEREKELLGGRFHTDVSKDEGKELHLLYKEMVEELPYYFREEETVLTSSITQPALDDAWRLYLGLPQQHETFGISEYQPSKGVENKYYFSLKNFREDIIKEYNAYEPNGIMGIVDSLESKGGSEIVEYGVFVLPVGVMDEGLKSDVMGDFTLSLGNDENGYYISYYDVWDLGGEKFGIEGEEGVFGKPFEIYDRIYYDPETFEILDDETEEEISCE